MISTRNLVIAFFAIIVFNTSCQKSQVEPTEEDLPEVYEVASFSSQESVQMASGKSESIVLDDINSLATDSKGNIYLIDWNSHSLLKRDVSGKYSQVSGSEKITNQPNKVFITNDDAVIFTTLYQDDAVLFYYQRSGESLKIFPNILKKTNDVFSNTSYVYSAANGNLNVVYGEELYEISWDQKTNKLLSKEVLSDGLQTLGNTNTINANGELLFPTDNFTALIDKAPLAKIDKNFNLQLIKAEKSLDNEKSVYTQGDGTLPNAFVGNILALSSDKSGNVFILEERDFSGDYIRLRKMDKNLKVTTLVGGIVMGNTNGIGDKAGFKYIRGMTLMKDESILISTSEGLVLVRKVE